MDTDPQARQSAVDAVSAMWQNIGHSTQNQDSGLLGGLGGGLGQQLTEFVNMPMEMAQIFINMAVQIAELTITSIEEAGVVLVKGLSPV